MLGDLSASTLPPHQVGSTAAQTPSQGTARRPGAYHEVLQGPGRGEEATKKLLAIGSASSANSLRPQGMRRSPACKQRCGARASRKQLPPCTNTLHRTYYHRFRPPGCHWLRSQLIGAYMSPEPDTCMQCSSSLGRVTAKGTNPLQRNHEERAATPNFPSSRTATAPTVPLLPLHITSSPGAQVSFNSTPLQQQPQQHHTLREPSISGCLQVAVGCWNFGWATTPAQVSGSSATLAPS